MKLRRIISDRQYKTWPSYHIIYEWEDELSAALRLPVFNNPEEEPKRFLYKKLKKIDDKIFSGKLIETWNEAVIFKKGSLYFEMHPRQKKGFSNSKKTTPLILDFWERKNITHFKKIYDSCPVLLVTSLEAINFLKENNVRNELIHFPMSLPSIYKLNSADVFEKKYDIVLAGRANPVLLDYLKQYEKEHPEIEYLQQIQKNGEHYYLSNKRGIVGKFHSREEYISLIKQAKISFYSTPGIDGGEQRTNGFNPVTPRFLELLSAGCHIIARYPKNVETDFFQLETICPSINSYQHFKAAVNTALCCPQPVARNAEYLLSHYTSVRLKLLTQFL